MIAVGRGMQHGNTAMICCFFDFSLSRAKKPFPSTGPPSVTSDTQKPCLSTPSFLWKVYLAHEQSVFGDLPYIRGAVFA